MCEDGPQYTWQCPYGAGTSGSQPSQASLPVELAHGVWGCANYGDGCELCNNFSAGLRSLNTLCFIGTVEQPPSLGCQSARVAAPTCREEWGSVAQCQTWAARRAQKFPDPAPHLPAPKGAAASFP